MRSLRAKATWALALGLSALGAPARAALDPALLQAYENRPLSAIGFEGLKVTREYVVTRELRSRVGEPFRLAVLEGDFQRLENLGLFAEMSASALEDANGEGVRLTVHLKEMPALIVFPSFVYTEENGFSYGAALSAMNLTGRGISLSARLYFGGTEQRYAKLSYPWITGNHVSFDFFGGKRERADTMNGFQEDSWEFTPAIGTWIGETRRFRAFASLFKMRSDVAGKTLDPDDEDRFLRFGASIGNDTRDSWRDPRQGWKNELEVIATTGAGSFLTMNLDLRRYLPTAAGQHLLLSSLLTLQTGTVGEDVPGYLTYYLGGANTIRGYTLDKLGPTLNGKNQLLTTTEYNVKLMPIERHDVFRWSFSVGLELALFADAGIAWSDPSRFGWKWFRAGTGAGLRLLVPGAEQVRFDVGWSPQGGLHFHFASGTKPTGQRQRLR